MYLGKNIKYLRRKAGMTQEDLANQLSLQNSAIGKWERGHNLPTVDTLIVLSGLFSVSTDELLSIDLEARPQVQSEEKGKGTEAELAALRAEVVAMQEKLAQTHSQDPALLEMAAAFMRQLKAKYPEVAKEMGLIE
jgi:transcriptional regulator with XRE-family HTH domain